MFNPPHDFIAVSENISRFLLVKKTQSIGFRNPQLLLSQPQFHADSPSNQFIDNFSSLMLESPFFLDKSAFFHGSLPIFHGSSRENRHIYLSAISLVHRMPKQRLPPLPRPAACVAAAVGGGGGAAARCRKVGAEILDQWSPQIGYPLVNTNSLRTGKIHHEWEIPLFL